MSSLPEWRQRTREEAALLNPAFVALVVHQATQTFEEESGDGLPFALAFLVPPVVVAQGIRTRLPDRKDSSLAAWVQNHPEIRLRFGEHAVAMMPVVREAVLFALTTGTITLADARLRTMALPKGLAPALANNTEEVRDVMRKAKFVGRWYANAGTTETIMALWGVRP